MTADPILAKLFERIGDKIQAKGQEHKMEGDRLEAQGRTGWATHEFMMAAVLLEVALAFKDMASEELGGVPT